MTYETAKEFQNWLSDSLSRYFSNQNLPVEPEWRPFINEHMDSSRTNWNIYSPAVDVAVGPFAYTNIQIDSYNQLTNRNRNILNKCLEVYRSNARGYDFEPDIPHDCSSMDGFNQNARCFIAIEIEFNGSVKHRLGDIINACSLGRIGMVILANEKVMMSFLRIAQYLKYLDTVNKNTYSTKNLIIMTKEQILKELILT